MDGKGPSHRRPGQVKQSGSTLKFGPSYSASRRAEHFLLTSIVSYWWRVIFWTRPAETCLSEPTICSLEPRTAFLWPQPESPCAAAAVTA
jgi:hypothetical protein